MTETPLETACIALVARARERCVGCCWDDAKVASGLAHTCHGDIAAARAVARACTINPLMRAEIDRLLGGRSDGL
jgi:hypothetical protein